MDAKLKADWIAALRSGRYKQARGVLRQGLDSPSYCCLGVLACVAGSRIGAGGNHLAGEDGSDCGYSPFDLMLGNGVDYSVLTNMNDGGESFARIADYIEANISAGEHSVTE